MAEEWEMVVPSRTVSPAPGALLGGESSEQMTSSESHGPAAPGDSDLHVFAAPWESPVKVGSAGEGAGVLGPLVGQEDARLGGSAVFVSAPAASESDGSPSVATPMQVANPARAESLLDDDAEMVSSQVCSLQTRPVQPSSAACGVGTTMAPVLQQDAARFMMHEMRIVVLSARRCPVR